MRILGISIFLLITNGLCAQDSLNIHLGNIGLSFEQDELDSLREGVHEFRSEYNAIRAIDIPNDVPFSMVYTPPVNENFVETDQENIDFGYWTLNGEPEVPKRKEDLAFYPVYELAKLIKHKKITSEKLTKLFLNRLKRFGDTLECVITITEELALQQARKADKEIAEGKYKGPLHGIPYGAKDLLAVKGYPTTWGAKPYKDQVIEENATVIQKLEEAGAILVAKLSMGALAWGDVWYGGVTKNPWNVEEGSSGSSAGSASATAAGLVPFAIGTETWGSIVSPSTRCGTTGLRPTYGRVSKHGAMALSWSMDKIGPICRNAFDCAIVFEAIRGADGKDLSVRDAAFNYKYFKPSELRVGYLKSLFKSERDSLTLALLESEGIELIEKEIPDDVPVRPLSFILTAEASAAFDELTRSNRDTLMVRQIKNAWPNVFRSGRFIPAVEYIQANRLRYLATLAFNEMMADIDVLITPSFGGNQLLYTNLSGHPCVVLPNGSYADGNAGSISLIGNHFDEASILEFARYLQELTSFEEEFPEMFK